MPNNLTAKQALALRRLLVKKGARAMHAFQREETSTLVMYWGSKDKQRDIVRELSRVGVKVHAPDKRQKRGFYMRIVLNITDREVNHA